MSQGAARTTRKRTPAKMTLREKLALKRARIQPVFFPLGDEGDRAIKRVDDAERELQLARIFQAKNPNSDVDIPKLEKVLRDVEAERENQCLVIRIRGLTDDERDALASEYQPQEIPRDADPEKRKEIDNANAQKIKDWTFAALETAVLESDLTAAEWREELTSDRWSAGDVDRLRVGIQLAYGAQPADGIPKD